MLSIEYIFLVTSVLLFLSIVASKISIKLGIPALLLFLLIGILAGSDGPGGIYFDNSKLAQQLGIVGLVFILFAGGFDTKWEEVKQIAFKGLSLATLGILVSTFLVGFFAHKVLNFSWLEGLLLGAIISSTDAAAVFTVLRGKNINLKKGLKSLIELESGCNDPLAVFLTVALLQLITGSTSSILELLILFVKQFSIGTALGYGIGKISVLLLKHFKLEYEGLYPVLTIALVAFTYGATTYLGGNGFLSVYLLGLVIGKHDFKHKEYLMHFHDGIAWLVQIMMFLTLGLLVFPSHLPPVIKFGLLTSLFLVFIARPISVLISLAFAKMSFSEKSFITWGGLRGAVPIILATFPMLAGIPKAETIFNLVFFVVIVSVLLQGTTIPLIVKLLKVEESS